MKLIISGILLVFQTLFSYAQTTIPGGTVSGIWTLGGSPYEVEGSIMVPDGETLTIEPGVEVSFQGHYKLLVLGRILAVGTVVDSIYFTASNTVDGWYGMKFDGTPASNDTSRLSYCSLRWGRANGSNNDGFGGAVFMNNITKLVVSNCTLRNNWALYGGGIASLNSISKIVNCKISANTYASDGGGIYTNGGTSIIGNTISGNSSFNSNVEGGGLWCSHAVEIMGNTISNNTTNGGYGGGINCVGCSGSIIGNVISYNYDNTAGGGIRLNNGSSPEFSGNFVCNNSTDAGGAGMMISNQSDPVMNNNVIANNHEESTYAYAGGAMLLWNSNPIITNNTIVNNSSSTTGGGIFCHEGSSPTFTNCILYGNASDDEGDQVMLNDEQSDPNFYYCNIEGGTAAFGLNGNFFTGTTSNNFDSDPLFLTPSSGVGTSHDGYTANWSLQPNSPCIDAGNPVGSYSAFDIAGNPRVLNIIDVGAYEGASTVGMTTEPDLIDVSVFPNPTINVFTIRMNERAHSTIQITLTDASGRLVYRNETNEQFVEIATSNFVGGLYYYSLINQEGTELSRGKMVVVKR
ncbi:MAG: T9SS type A sorting domain-containing protein [Flavobacteriales bacterium]|nr:T9SS type A sorting domain-containing protein [Flavobacteriales bacterium]